MKDDIAYLGQTNPNTWVNSDSKEFKNWFYTNRKEEKNSQIIRFLKAWRDNNKSNFTSIELTIIGVKYFVEDKRVDLALLYTLENIFSQLNLFRKIDKPVAPFENLWESLSIREIDNKISSIRNFMEDIRNAINNSSNKRASLIFIELFGNRFPGKKDENENKYVEYESGAKPWGLK